MTIIKLVQEVLSLMPPNPLSRFARFRDCTLSQSSLASGLLHFLPWKKAFHEGHLLHYVGPTWFRSIAAMSSSCKILALAPSDTESTVGDPTGGLTTSLAAISEGREGDILTPYLWEHEMAHFSKGWGFMVNLGWPRIHPACFTYTKADASYKVLPDFTAPVWAPALIYWLLYLPLNEVQVQYRHAKQEIGSRAKRGVARDQTVLLSTKLCKVFLFLSWHCAAEELGQ